jgi:serine/threonine-protein kinase
MRARITRGTSTSAPRAARRSEASSDSWHRSIQRSRTVASESGARPPSPGRQGFVAGDVVGRYELERVLGEGGLGVVWAARHATTRKPVALKLMKFGDPELAKRFLREARVGAALNHPAAVPVHDIFESEPGGPLVMVMDLSVGEPLDQLLLVRGSLGLDETLRIMHPVIAAVGAAHALGIVHRDIKPGNIFVVRAEHDKGAPPARLLDFGLARLTATEGAVAATSVLTREKTLMGTPHYMAPEQLYGEADIDARADVWAVGAVLFECLSGRRPLEGATIGQILRSLATTEVPPLASIAAGTPPALGRAVDACLARDRNTRPFSVNHSSKRSRLSCSCKLRSSSCSCRACRHTRRRRDRSTKLFLCGPSVHLQEPLRQTDACLHSELELELEL